MMFRRQCQSETEYVARQVDPGVVPLVCGMLLFLASTCARSAAVRYCLWSVRSASVLLDLTSTRLSGVSLNLPNR